MLRSHTCGELTEEHIGQSVTLAGWVDTYRDHGGGLFVDLRDRYGLTQVVFNPPDTSDAIIEESKTLRPEYVVQVTGNVAARPEGMANPKMATGAIELRATEFKLLNKSLTPPVSPSAAEPPRRRPPAEAPLSRPPSSRDAASHAATRFDHQRHARLLCR